MGNIITGCPFVLHPLSSELTWLALRHLHLLEGVVGVAAVVEVVGVDAVVEVVETLVDAEEVGAAGVLAEARITNK